MGPNNPYATIPRPQGTEAYAARYGETVELRTDQIGGDFRRVIQTERTSAPYVTFAFSLNRIGTDPVTQDMDPEFTQVVAQVSYGAGSGQNIIEVDIGRGSQLSVPADTSVVGVRLETARQGGVFLPVGGPARGVYRVGVTASCGNTRAARSYVTRTITSLDTDIEFNIPRSAYAVNIFPQSPDWYASESVQFGTTQNYPTSDPSAPGVVPDSAGTDIQLDASAFLGLNGEGVKIPNWANSIGASNPTGQALVMVFALNV